MERDLTKTRIYGGDLRNWRSRDDDPAVSYFTGFCKERDWLKIINVQKGYTRKRGCR
jgi:hypothetical protein